MSTFYKESDLRDKLVKLFKRVNILIGDGTTAEELADKIIKYYDAEWDTRQEAYEQGCQDAKSGN